MDAHRDVDEVALEEEQRRRRGRRGARASSSAARAPALRCPRHAHVLYLGLGDETSRADGLGGGPTAQPRAPGAAAEGGEPLRAPTCVWSASSLVVVPAVPGRLLRFNGAALHSVPRPALKVRAGPSPPCAWASCATAMRLSLMRRSHAPEPRASQPCAWS